MDCISCAVSPHNSMYSTGAFGVILSILVDTLNSYKEDSYAAIGRAA